MSPDHVEGILRNLKIAGLINKALVVRTAGADNPLARDPFAERPGLAVVAYASAGSETRRREVQERIVSALGPSIPVEVHFSHRGEELRTRKPHKR